MRSFLVGFITLCSLLICVAQVISADKTNAAKEKSDTPAVLNFKMEGLDGKEVDLATYKGKVVMFVNVASKCGKTPQYTALQALYEKYGKEGLVIIGVPANDFRKQEPGTNKDIAEFCTSKYHVTFPMLGKVTTIVGSEKVGLYNVLTSKETNPKHAGEIKWNFTKFLVGRNGEIVNRFEPNIEPDAEEVVEAIKAELAKKA